MNQENLINIGETVCECARNLFEKCEATEDFCIQVVGGTFTVFGGVNRVLYRPEKGFTPDLGYCTDRFLVKYGHYMYGAPIARKKHALVPETRLRVCPHDHVYFQGKVPCTGPRVCSMCEMTFVSDDEIKMARQAAEKELQKRR